MIVLYLSIAFEWKMAAAAFVALLHDIVITVGVYALAGFQVSPATVTGLLTILGYSLYDTVVVFDKVRENTAGLTAGGNQRTSFTSYSDAANLALNQTLVRSINTSLIALLPVTAILIASTVLLPPGELSDLALVLFVGMLSGTYSSIFIATPVLADLKEREPKMKQLKARAAARAASPRTARPGDPDRRHGRGRWHPGRGQCRRSGHCPRGRGRRARRRADRLRRDGPGHRPGHGRGHRAGRDRGPAHHHHPQRDRQFRRHPFGVPAAAPALHRGPAAYRVQPEEAAVTLRG